MTRVVREAEDALINAGVLYGWNKDAAAQASSAASRGYIKELDNWLSDITSIDKLETFERELKTVMND